MVFSRKQRLDNSLCIFRCYDTSSPRLNHCNSSERSIILEEQGYVEHLRFNTATAAATTAAAATTTTDSADSRGILYYSDRSNLNLFVTFLFILHKFINCILF